MDIDRLKELKWYVEDEVYTQNVRADILALLDEAIARQSVTSEEVAEAISWAKGMEILYEEKQMPECADCAKTAITALKGYQQVAISKTETTSEEDDTYSQCVECGQFHLDGRGYEYCPHCGERFERYEWEE